MLDFTKWAKRAAAFTEDLRGFPGKPEIQVQVGVPETRDRVEAISAGCPLRIPNVLADWYLSVGSCHCTYFLHLPPELQHDMALAFPNVGGKSALWGGANLFDLSDAPTPNDTREIAESFQDSGFANDAQLWGNSFPLIRELNGDFISLYAENGETEPSVAYLCYEMCGGSRIISPSFELFMQTWEKLGYIGIHFFYDFINPKTGHLDAEYRKEAVAALHRIFGQR